MISRVIQTFLTVFILFAVFSNRTLTVQAKAPAVGIHILRTDELEAASKLLSVAQGQDVKEWQYVTVPFSLADLERSDDWHSFFQSAKEKRIIPVVRLVTAFDSGSWAVPTRRDLVLQLDLLAKMDWPVEQRYIIIGNEVNHAAEWGGTIDPAGYARTFVFASNWARTQPHPFTVLPAAMDLAAPNGTQTMEAFQYLDKMIAAEPEFLASVDIWNSHSYPNPGFSASPERTGKNSLRGFEHELAFLKKHAGTDFKVLITETGWDDNSSTARWLPQYYEYALRHIWNHPQVIAVTPFVLQGAPGPFAGFSFLDEAQQPTRQYLAFQKAVKKLEQEQHLLSSVTKQQ